MGEQFQMENCECIHCSVKCASHICISLALLIDLVSLGWINHFCYRSWSVFSFTVLFRAIISVLRIYCQNLFYFITLLLNNLHTCFSVFEINCILLIISETTFKCFLFNLSRVFYTRCENDQMNTSAKTNIIARNHARSVYKHFWMRY